MKPFIPLIPLLLLTACSGSPSSSISFSSSGPAFEACPAIARIHLYDSDTLLAAFSAMQEEPETYPQFVARDEVFAYSEEIGFTVGGVSYLFSFDLTLNVISSWESHWSYDQSNKQVSEIPNFSGTVTLLTTGETSSSQRFDASVFMGNNTGACYVPSASEPALALSSPLSDWVNKVLTDQLQVRFGVSLWNALEKAQRLNRALVSYRFYLSNPNQAEDEPCLALSNEAS